MLNYFEIFIVFQFSLTFIQRLVAQKEILP